MNDKEFTDLHIRASIVPKAEGWPDDLLHWQRIKAVVIEARTRLSNAYAELERIDADADLSAEGKARKKKKVAAEAIADFQQSKTLASAKETVERQVAKWEEKTGMVIKPPANIAEAVVYSEIRAHLAAMKENKVDFVERHLSDPRVTSAVLSAPPFLSGLTDAEIAVVQTRIEQHVAPEIAGARDATLKAVKEAEHGWQRAMDKIGERAGLTKGADGTGRVLETA